MKKRGKRRSQQRRANARRTKLQTAQKVPAAGAGGAPAKNSPPVEEAGESKKSWNVREIVIVAGAALTLVSFMKDAADLLDWVDRIVAGYRQFYSSIWRSITSALPGWLRPYDASQTYDALMFMSLIAATLIGSRRMSSRAQFYDGVAACFLSMLFQLVTIRLWERTPYDVVATTTVNFVIIGVCIASAITIEFRYKTASRTVRWIPLAVAASTLLIAFAADNPRMLYETVAGALPPSLGVDIGQMQRIVWTAGVLTIAGFGVYLGYVLRGPRRPLVAWTVGLAVVIFAVSLVGGVIERAMRDAGWMA